MGLNGKDLTRLGPNARKQIMRELARAPREKRKAPITTESAFESELEREYYERYIFPFLASGQIVKVELHREFLLLPASEYCGIKLPAARYTPDFVVTYESGGVEAVEVKNKVIRKLQRDYIYRRRLFIDLVARPQGWKFREYVKG